MLNQLLYEYASINQLKEDLPLRNKCGLKLVNVFNVGVTNVGGKGGWISTYSNNTIVAIYEYIEEEDQYKKEEVNKEEEEEYW